MSYLISGLPRCRTAWLTALLHAHGSRCYHDAYVVGAPLDGSVNIVDPAVACMEPEAASCFDQRICIMRDPDDSRAALERWGGRSLPGHLWDVYLDNIQKYQAYSDKTFQVEDLEDNDIVGEIIELCTNRAASSAIIQTFQLLRIEEHMPKAERLSSSQTSQ